MILADLLYKVSIRAVLGSTNIEVNNLQVDSRKVKTASCFMAIKGSLMDGHQFIDLAIQNGATAIICEILPVEVIENITYVQVENTAVAAGYISHNFYGAPSASIKLVGVTGTNGKTTIITLLWKLFTALGYKCGLISTIHNQIGDEVVVATHTTPDAISVNALLSQMVDAGCQYVFMECSSHAIHQHRIAGLQFTGALFSNISHDHLDYHTTFDEYIRVKKSWFDGLPSSAFAISNADDKRGRVMLQNTSSKNIIIALQPWLIVKERFLTIVLPVCTWW